jgi:iron complex outermembrane receptor protein
MSRFSPRHSSAFFIRPGPGIATQAFLPLSPIPATFMVWGLLSLSTGSPAQTTAQPPPSSFQPPPSSDASNPSPEDLKQMSIEDLMNLDVTSVSLHPERLLDAASAIQVVTGDDILRSGASSLPEALQLADNLEVAQKNSHDWAISARGFNTDLSNKLLVLVDGRTVYSPLFSGVFWDAQDYLLEDIDRIEVISGPGGSLWGANAVNGVINIETKSAKDTQGTYFEAGGGGVLEDFAGLRYGGTLAPNVDFRIYGKYSSYGDELLANGSDAHDGWSHGQGGFRIDGGASSQNTLTVEGDLYGGDEEEETGGNTKNSGGHLLGKWSHTAEDGADTSLQIYYDRTQLVDPAPALVLGGRQFAPAGILDDALDTYDVAFQQRFGLGDRQQLTWGLGYRYTHDVVNNAPALAFFPPTLDQSLYSGFVQDEIRLADKLRLTVGSKFEHNDYTGAEAEPSARLQWKLADNQSLWTAVSRAVRTPSRIDHDLSEAAPPDLVLLRGSSDFEDETLTAYELGYRAQLGSDFSASVSTYYNHYDDLRSTSITPGTVLPFVFANNLEGDTQGVEVSGDYRLLDWWRLHGGGDFLNEQLRVKPGQIDINDAHNETADPKWQFSFRSSMDLPHQVDLDLGLRWVDTLLINNGPTVGTVPSYFELDARLAWHPTKQLELSIVGQNLLHSEHAEYGFPSPTQEEIARNIFGKIRWTF